MASASPQNSLPQPSYSTGTSGQDTDPLSVFNLSILKTLAEKRATRDGNPPKRRGPKPGSKPALTRRQELNRQAQRTHRERKEAYIKALEDEVLRLREIFSNIAREKERLVEENRRLKTLLAQVGINYGRPVTEDLMSQQSTSCMSSSSIAGSYGPGSSNSTAFTPPPLSACTGPMEANAEAMTHGPNLVLDYEQIGIDFVLTLEKPCMNHMPWLLERNYETGLNEPCGHALMASCPPEPFSDLTPDIPFGDSYGNRSHSGTGNKSKSNTACSADGGTSQDSTSAVGNHGQRTWELSKADLTTLLDLSKKLDLDGEITPVMAWGMILGHPRFSELREEDFVRLTEELKGKVRCYGFGAVMEEFEVRDALESIFATKMELGVAY
ncbi:uncharacterized protein CTHT_0003600 [Thermochaetoides thermophila DSM 1495]|uniref:BZIP domain-containing protein n=1 Tax=Chaetomium thermophilum (strain DSM 1495 / CBS 144.50 / IMI 039719) TaxID=759272 RepID=G0RZN5_CHATD|nr:hypothetical protein CTHT_0003600 [Thermochaetoides thermophila DSM 1495]EGS23663.1 hypothetical protein CTHT_0003600 [Thermochaetoides thermophila DSM 1495]